MFRIWAPTPAPYILLDPGSSPYHCFFLRFSVFLISEQDIWNQSTHIWQSRCERKICRRSFFGVGEQWKLYNIKASSQNLRLEDLNPFFRLKTNRIKGPEENDTMWYHGTYQKAICVPGIQCPRRYWWWWINKKTKIIKKNKYKKGSAIWFCEA